MHTFMLQNAYLHFDIPHSVIHFKMTNDNYATKNYQESSSATMLSDNNDNQYKQNIYMVLAHIHTSNNKSSLSFSTYDRYCKYCLM